ncbi:GIN domain-containing protein [Sinomicrobium oceani]|uniref:GIN domain-containing protein n=1 Tax=Sinomicrobium oceani TaxID=1150368 RepID=UPI00227ADA3A|nr:DUF2807 domain-containing protein [Sinomicrobium oceani]
MENGKHKFTIFSLLLYVFTCSGISNAQVQSKEISLDNINNLEISNFLKVIYKQSDDNKIVIEYDNVLADFIEIKSIKDNELIIRTKYPRNLDIKQETDKKVMKAKNRVNVYGKFELISSVKTSHASKVIIDINNKFHKNTSFDFNFCGAIEGKLIAEKSVISSNASDFKISGHLDYLKINSKNSNFSNYDLKCANLVISAENSNLKFTVKNELSIIDRLVNTNINYKDSPKLNIDPSLKMKNSPITKM